MTRYASGEEPMVGDVVLHESEGEQTVCAIGPGKYDRFEQLLGFKGHAAGEGPGWFVECCSLIRRGEQSSTALVAQRPELVAQTCNCGRRSMLCDAQGRCPDCQKATLLGHDRNGREVRKGDRILAVDMGFVCTVSELHPDGRFAGMSEKQGLCSVPEQHAELVDEKAERRFAVGNVEALGEKAEQIGCVDNSGHVWESGFCRYCRCAYHQAAAIESGVIDQDHFGFSAAGKTAAPIVESFSRWLARPTMGERFEEFKEKVSAALHRFSVFDVAAVTDMTSDGFLMRLRVGESRCDMHCKDDVSWTMVEGFVSIAVASEADRIGRESLKRKEPRQ